MKHHYTEEQKKFLTDNIKGRTTYELTDMFNDYFKLELKRSQIRAFTKNNHLISGLDGRFEKGHVPVNKGTKGIYNVGGNKTSFKKGIIPHNRVPIGTERIDRDGYIVIKIQDGKLNSNWKFKHHIIWEKENGPIPKGYAIIFGDDDNRNFNIDNLIRVSRKQLLTLNQKGLIKNNADLTRTGVIIADLYSKISKRKNK